MLEHEVVERAGLDSQRLQNAPGVLLILLLDDAVARRRLLDALIGRHYSESRDDYQHDAGPAEGAQNLHDEDRGQDRREGQGHLAEGQAFVGGRPRGQDSRRDKKNQADLHARQVVRQATREHSPEEPEDHGEQQETRQGQAVDHVSQVHGLGGALGGRRFRVGHTKDQNAQTQPQQTREQRSNDGWW